MFDLFLLSYQEFVLGSQLLSKVIEPAPFSNASNSKILAGIPR